VVKRIANKQSASAQPLTHTSVKLRETGDHDSHSGIQFNGANRANLRKDKEAAIEKRIRQKRKEKSA